MQDETYITSRRQEVVYNRNGAYRMLVCLNAEAFGAATFVVFVFAPGSNDNVVREGTSMRRCMGKKKFYSPPGSSQPFRTSWRARRSQECLDVSVVSLVGPFRNIMAFFTSFQIARPSALEPEENALAMEILHLRYSRWGPLAVKLSGEVANLKELHAAVRNQEDVSEAKVVLARSARHFEDIAKITTGRKN